MIDRVKVLKTYKLYIGGAFPRTESGRYYTPSTVEANVCLSSRKDFRNAVVAARKAFGGWSSKTHFNRSQILYRIAEMMEGRKDQLTAELVQQGIEKKKAATEVEKAIDLTIYYAGWCDKYLQVFSSINPVASSHFNFTTLEPTGVVAVMAPEKSGLIGFLASFLPAILSGNTVVVLAAENYPLTAITFAEILATSDLSGGVVNILTGKREELNSHMASHMDVNALVFCGEMGDMLKEIQEKASENVKRIIHNDVEWFKNELESPYNIKNLLEAKTTWHPIENIGGATGGY